jgi:hypothetical protein
MTRDNLHRNLLEALFKKIPEKTELVEMLMTTLFLEKGAVYRRLNGEVPFSFLEVVNIAEKMDISLTNLAYTDSVQTGRFELKVIEYFEMNEMEYKQWEDYISMISLAKNDPHSELVESSNVLPISVYGGFDSLSKFFLFKYQYLFFGTENRISYSDLVVPERLYRIHQSYFNESKNFANTTFIWDYLIFQYLVTDIRFFSEINLISKDDVQQIRKDLFALLDYIEEIALKGSFEETGKPVSFYISDINLDADYCYVKLNDMYISHVRAFILNSVKSTNQSSFRKIKDWIHSLKKSSTLITQSAAAYRADFFEKQRKMVSEL